MRQGHHLPRCASQNCRYAVSSAQSRYCSVCDPSGGAPASPGASHGLGGGATPSGSAARSGPRPASPLRTDTPRGTPHSQSRGTPQQQQQHQQQQQQQPLPQRQPQQQQQPSQPAQADFAVACGPLEAGGGSSSSSSSSSAAAGQQQLTEVVVGALHADPMVPLCFNLQASGAFVRVRMPSGEVVSWELPLEMGRREGGAAAAPAAAAAATPPRGLFGSLMTAALGAAAGGAAAARRPPTLPLRVEVSLNARTRMVVVRLGSMLEGGSGSGSGSSGSAGGTAGGGLVWVPALFFTHRFSQTRAESDQLASLAGWGARVREVGASIDALCDQPRVAPLLALLAASRGPLKWEVRRLAALRRGLLDEIKAFMAAIGGEGGGEGGAGGEGAAAAQGREVARLCGELGKLRDDVGALTLRVGEGGGEEGGGGEEAAAASIGSGGAQEALAAAFREAFHNAQLCAGHAAGVESAEAGEEAAGARGRGFGLRLPLTLAHSQGALLALRGECSALFAAARTAAREKAECLKAHFGATTPRSRIEGLARWVQDVVRCTGAACFGELSSIAVERSDGIPLLT